MSDMITIFQHETNGRDFTMLIWQDDNGRTRITRHDRADDPFYDIIVIPGHPVELSVQDNTLRIVRSKGEMINGRKIENTGADDA